MSGTADLAGRRVVITGAAGGIGRAVAAELARRQARLTLVGRRLGPLREVASGLPGGPHLPVGLDVTDEQGWRSAAADWAGGGPLHGLVAAAAILGPIGAVGSWAVGEFRRTLEVNVIGTLIPLTALLDLLEPGTGAVVTFSGGGATAAFPRYDAYAASKSAVARLTENLSGDLAERGVRINAVAPGFVVSGMHHATMAAGPRRAGAAYFGRTERALGSGEADPPGAAAELVAFLLSDRAAGITGRLISARWDPWRDPAFQERLRSDADLGTIRRIDDQFFIPRPDR